LDQATLKKFDEQSAKLQEEIYDDMKYIGQLEAELKQTLAKLDERVADATTDFYINELQEIFKDCPEVVSYLLDVKRDVLKNITKFFNKKMNKIKIHLRSYNNKMRLKLNIKLIYLLIIVIRIVRRSLKQFNQVINIIVVKHNI